ncbi:carbohydrate ABC transporter permease [Streptomyces sp. BH-SS-21]|uniref:Carbohydrate ABC transporter permease n=1 Tax=Streptomyces liliiviolaceus TaxID=2823109 RepID=A0A941BD83_9ACTN|nr:carbohydrate ABC transporter permease [Streptomyces liliiviolaceus]MBQ0855537.1 carbohydrate ABC transporter permease [Streptomyces liliiviolaceus]
MARYTARTFARELLLLAVAAIWAVPFFLLILVSLKPSEEMLSSPMSVPRHPDFSNFAQAWDGSSGVSLSQAMVNSLVITVGSVVSLVVIGALCAYVIARRPGRLGSGLYGLFVVGIVVPFQLGIVPAYALLRELDLAGTYIGMILLYTGLLMPLAVFLYTGFVRTLPRDYEEAAYIDGASRLQTFIRIVFPLLRPITATVAVITGVMVWNDFFVQLIFLSGSSLQTVPVAVYSFVGEYVTQWNIIFAAVGASVLPILAFYLIAQRQLIRGFTGGIKA